MAGELDRIVNAVRARAERTGARILVEGIETRRHAETARTLGVTVGEGWLYGRPGMLPEAARPPRAPLGLLPEPAAVEDQTPFEMVSAEPGVLLACFQEVRHFSPGTRVRSGGWRPGRP